ncbi:peptidoglycan-binding protein [Aquimarina sp. D1M17]|uniref:peptidoglycan-binding domain-containing protein n=1 Tax=Aquimarina acroporae TaxID=2937283 RepID=UPI0020BEA6F2|nr:peptidoglycan-binding domain-containing protein [Aquimarina acroporae]MCK8523079.1 peptidoglycan-binding protein [Aquimarina acroporae]
MAIYISQKATSNIPDEFLSSYLPTFGSKGLTSNHFKNLPFFQNLLLQGQGADVVTKEGTYDVDMIRVLQVGISAVSAKLEIGDKLDLDGIFGNLTENAVKRIQTKLGLPETGQVDGETLRALDYQLSGDVYFDNTLGKFSGENSEVVIAVNKSGVGIKTYISEGLNAVQSGEIEQLGVFNYLPPKSDLQFGVALFEGAGESNLNKNNAFYIEDNKEGILIPTITEIPEPGARLVEVKPNESLISIIYEEYYKEAYPILRKPNPDNPNDPLNDKSNPANAVHTFPARELKQDARLKFITNLIFYMNTAPGVANGIDWADGYEKYSLDDLDKISIYDNDSYKLNYQVFLERLKEENPNYDWQFVSDNRVVNGVTYNFDAPVVGLQGNHIWLPSRTYVEGLYYSLNFCPKEGEMYQKKTKSGSVTPDNPEGTSYFDWIDDVDFSDFLNIAEQNLRDIVQYAEETITDIIDTYKEARTFFVTMYDWLLEVGELGWPRGFGVSTEGGAVLSGPLGPVPATGNIGGDAYIWRKVTDSEHFVINLREKFILGLGADIGVGVGISFGGKGKAARNNGAGKGNNSKKNVKYGGGATLSADLTFNYESTSVYEFDISKSNTPLVAMAIALFENSLDPVTPLGRVKSNITNGLKKAANYFLAANIDPEDYLIYYDAGIYTQGRIYGDAYVGSTANDNQWALGNVKKSDRLKFNGITGLIEYLSFGGNSENFLRFGGKFTYKAEFDNLPDVYDADFRMPSKVNLEGEIYYEGQAQLNIRFKEFLSRFMLGTLQMTGLLWIPSFNLHAGIAILHNLEYTRNAIPEDHEFFSHIFNISQPFSITDPGNNISKKIGFKVFSGDLDTPLIPGSELAFFLEFGKLKEFILQAENNGSTFSDYVTNIDTLVELFSQMSLRKRLTLGNGITNRNSRKAKRIVETPRSRSSQFYKKTFKENNFILGLLNKGASFTSAVDVEATLETKEVLNTIKFVFEYLRFVVSQLRYTGENLVKYKKVEERVKGIICAKKETLASTITGDSVTATNLNTIFEEALQELEQIYQAELFDTSTLRPYTSLIGDFIKALDQDGVLSTLRNTPDTVVKTVSPYLTEIAEILKLVVKYLTTKSQLNVVVENSLEYSAGVSGEAGGGYKAKLGFYAEIGILYNRIEVLNKGELATIFLAEDPYFDLLLFFIKALGAASPELLVDSVLIGNLLTQNTVNKIQVR